MALVTLPIANGFYLSESLPLSAQQCVNWYPRIPEVPALSQEVLFGTPGLEQVATSGALYANRGAHVMAGAPYFVNGTTLYRLESDDTLTSLGTITGSGRVSMATNGTQLLILVPGSTGYVFTTGPDTLTTISDTDFTANGNPQAVVYIDGYFCFTTDSKKVIISALNDGTSYDALDFGSAEANPDGTVAPFVFDNRLFVGGERTIEGFSNVGGSGFPFQRSGLFLNKGIISPFAIGVTDTTFVFLGAGENEGPAIWALEGNGAVRISTKAIEAILERLTPAELSAVFCLAYAQGGHYFVSFALPDTALVYDSTTQRWHERKSVVTFVDSTSETQRWRANSIAQAYGSLYCGDSIDGRIGRLDLDVYQEYGTRIQRVAATQPFQNNMRPIFVPYMELTVESGVGDASTPDPQIVMERSKDGGKTWSYPRPRSMGALGEYSKRVIWRRLGRSERFDVYRFTLSDPVKPVLLQLTADVVSQ